jgi:mannose-binding lectin 2
LIACSPQKADFRGRPHATKARVKYTGKTLEIQLNIKDQGRWETCALINDVKGIPKEGYIGFTAATGEVSDNHDIVYVSTYAITSLTGAGSIPETQAYFDYNSATASGGEGWSVFFTFFVVIIIVGVAVGGFFGYRSASKNNKRF